MHSLAAISHNLYCCTHCLDGQERYPGCSTRLAVALGEGHAFQDSGYSFLQKVQVRTEQNKLHCFSQTEPAYCSGMILSNNTTVPTKNKSKLVIETLGELKSFGFY